MEFPNPDNPYYRKMIEWINSYEENLWNNLERVPLLDSQVSQSILNHFLELACQCQNVGNILSGRHGILSLPRRWTLNHIEAQAESLLLLEDNWEWWRLMEVYDSLDKGMAKKLALRSLNHPDRNINEVGKTYLQR